MIRYVSRPRAMFDSMEEQMRWIRPETLTVFEHENNSYKTGLLDVRGNPIYAVNEIEQIGFIPPGEWD